MFLIQTQGIDQVLIDSNDRMEMTLTAIMLFYCHQLFQSLGGGMCLKDSSSIREVYDACKCFWRMDHFLYPITEINGAILIAQCVACLQILSAFHMQGDRRKQDINKFVHLSCCHV